MAEFKQDDNKQLLETAKIEWCELQRFYAQGSLILISEELDLIQAASSIENDETKQVKQWLDNQQIGTIDDQQAKSFFAKNTLFWATIVKPYVLIQIVK